MIRYGSPVTVFAPGPPSDHRGDQPPGAAPGVLTLTVDCGGGGIKATVLDENGTLQAPAVRTPTPYPLPPSRLVDVVEQLAVSLPVANRLTLGMPGMIRHGVVVETPHYVTRSGPRSRVLPELVTAWSGYTMRAALEESLGIPALVLNDAEVAGAGAVTGIGLEMVLTFGTGLGNAVFDGGRLAPHIEISRGMVAWGTTYDEYVGEAERLTLGDAYWSRRIRRVVDGLRPMFVWDRLYLGGGNSRHISARVLERLGDDVVVVPNSAGLVGGVRAWELREGRRGHLSRAGEEERWSDRSRDAAGIAGLDARPESLRSRAVRALQTVRERHLAAGMPELTLTRPEDATEPD